MALARIFEFSFTDERGLPYDGGKVFTYKARSEIAVNTYKDIDGTVNDNPVMLDARGCATFYIDTAEAYRFVVYDSEGNFVKDLDDTVACSGGGESPSPVTTVSVDVKTDSQGKPHAEAQMDGSVLTMKFYNIQGEKGDKGDPLTFDDLTEEQKESIRGEKGETGERGEKGDAGEQGPEGTRGEKGEKGDKGDTGEKGEKGDAGETGERGEKGEKGDPGEKGEKGDKGEQGPSGASEALEHYLIGHTTAGHQQVLSSNVITILSLPDSRYSKGMGIETAGQKYINLSEGMWLVTGSASVRLTSASQQYQAFGLMLEDADGKNVMQAQGMVDGTSPNTWFDIPFSSMVIVSGIGPGASRHYSFKSLCTDDAQVSWTSLNVCKLA